MFAQIAAEVLGKDERCAHRACDTERLPFASNSWGSITTASVGPAVRVAAEEARDSLFEAAAGMLGAEPGDLESRDGEIHAKGHDRCMTIAQVCEKLGDVMIIGQGSRGPNPDKTAIAAFGAQFAEVEVDIETGIVRVLRIGRRTTRGESSIPRWRRASRGRNHSGVGLRAFEERVLDDRLGIPLNPTMHDYKIPTIADVPKIDAFFVEGSDTVANHTGAKGLAEPPIIGTAPAIANAVAHALGVEVMEIPLTPWRVLGALSSHA